MMLGQKIAVAFIDYTAAFDTVSHKYLDEALSIERSREAGVPVKIRVMFRVVYQTATAFTTTTARK